MARFDPEFGRWFRFSAPTANVLRRYLHVRGDRPSPFLWVTRGTGSPSRGLILQAVKRIGRAAGMPEVTVHSLRHTFATELLRHGSGLVPVSKLLGHSEVKTTQRYVHLDTTDLREAYEASGVVARVME